MRVIHKPEEEIKFKGGFKAITSTDREHKCLNTIRHETRLKHSLCQKHKHD